jgi:hypothetical protein
MKIRKVVREGEREREDVEREREM